MKYLLYCKKCKRPFWGRKNQIFCEKSCKAAYHNDLAADFRKELVDSKDMEQCYLLLKVFKKVYPDAEPFNIEDLQQEGFKTSVPVRVYHTPVNKFEYNIIHGFGYRFVDKTKGLIAINSLEEIYQL